MTDYLTHENIHNCSRSHRCTETCLRCRAIEFLLVSEVPSPKDGDDRECVIEQVAGELLSDEICDAFGNLTDEVDPSVRHIIPTLGVF